MNEPDRPPLSRNPLKSLLEWLRHQRDGGRTPTKPGRSAEQIQREKLRVQVGVIRRAFRGEVAAASSRGGGRAADDADTAYLFRPDHLLVRTDRREDFTNFFDRRRDDFEEPLVWPEESVIDGLALVPVPKRRDGRDSVLDTLDAMDREFGDGQVATPDHILYVTNRPGMCPATEPEMLTQRGAAGPWPSPARSRGRITDERRIRVAVVDTGLWTPAVGSAESPWLEKGEVVADAKDEEQVNPADIHEYAGHGTFVAGVVRCMAPDARVEVEGVLPNGGAVYESHIVEQLQEAIDDDDHPQIISISAGTHTRGDFALLGFEMFGASKRLAERDDIVIVAAAGNDASSERFWPAAFEWVVSVGSVDPDGKVSDFSNHGKTWVDVYARGRNHVNAFPKGIYTCYEPPNVGEVRKFDGLAQWSGTSFSTPLVSGLIAAHMQATGDSARKAADSVIIGGTLHHDNRINEDIKIVGPLT